MIIGMTYHDFDINIHVRVSSLDHLEESTRVLCEAAIAATKGSYAPYSHFNVGAAIRLDNGETVAGANQENAAFPSGMCAERTACYYAHAHYPDAAFEAVAIAASQAGELTKMPVSPCGACRQALLEYEVLAGHPVAVLLVGADCVYQIPSVSSLLPLAFTDF